MFAFTPLQIEEIRISQNINQKLFQCGHWNAGYFLQRSF